MSKFRLGQELVLVSGTTVIVRGVTRSVHQNTSLITLQDKASGKVWERPVRTGWLTKALKKDHK